MLSRHRFYVGRLLEEEQSQTSNSLQKTIISMHGFVTKTVPIPPLTPLMTGTFTLKLFRSYSGYTRVIFFFVSVLSKSIIFPFCPFHPKFTFYKAETGDVQSMYHPRHLWIKEFLFPTISYVDQGMEFSCRLQARFESNHWNIRKVSSLLITPLSKKNHYLP